tara:strand:+ start:1271 stop:1561 length:291 start_codon:yes stop_codon:yes gene_type:complete
MKKYFNQTTVNVIAIAGAAAWGLVFLGNISRVWVQGGLNTSYKLQTTENLKLDHDIARVKHCGQIIRSGIRISELSPSSALCADIRVMDLIAEPKE